jgi:hypothetical protein
MAEVAKAKAKSKANTQATESQADRAQTKGDGTDVVTRAELFHIGNNVTAKESAATIASAVLLLPLTLQESSPFSLASTVYLGARNWSRFPSASVVHPIQGQSVGYASTLIVKAV